MDRRTILLRFWFKRACTWPIIATCRIMWDLHATCECVTCYTIEKIPHALRRYTQQRRELSVWDEDIYFAASVLQVAAGTLYIGNCPLRHGAEVAKSCFVDEVPQQNRGACEPAKGALLRVSWVIYVLHDDAFFISFGLLALVLHEGQSTQWCGG